MSGGRNRLARWLVWAVWLLLLVGGWSPAWAGERTFPAGSLILPTDSCWQPAQPQPVRPGCAAGGSSAALAGAYGLAYRLQRAGVPVYRAGETSGEGLSFVIHGQGEPPVRELPDDLLSPPARNTPEGRLPASLVDYRGSPFLVDQRDLTPAALALVDSFPKVQRHQALVPFVAPVTRQLTGLPERLVVAEAAAATRVQELLTLAGMGGSAGVSVATALPSGVPAALLICDATAPSAAPQDGPCGLDAIFAALVSVPTTTIAVETVAVAPIIEGPRLYVASASFPGRTGHLRAFALNDSGRSVLWDAAEAVPAAGDVEPPCSGEDALLPPFPATGGERLLFTNAGAGDNFRLVRFDACAAASLAPYLGLSTAPQAAPLIDRVRAAPLGAFTHSTPAVVGLSAFVAGGLQRDRVIYAGSDAGLLQAFLAGSAALPAGDGRELWGYLPGSLLPMLPRQPWGDATAFARVRVDGSPAVGDQFADFDGDGRREWRTVLVGTASADGVAGVVFALDVTDPYRPQLLWERQLSGPGLGTSRGVAMTVPGSDGLRRPRVFLVGSPLERRDAAGGRNPSVGQFGVLACALDLVDGSLLWDYFAPYEGLAVNLNEPPAAPTLLSIDGRLQAVLFGDLAGRLWALDPASGQPVGGEPIYRLPGGSSTPITAGVAVAGRTVLFSSGGAEHVDPATRQALHAVEFLTATSRQLWSVPLAAGEQAAGAPLIDRGGRIYAAVGEPQSGRGRLLALNPDGSSAGALPLAGPPGDSLALAPGMVVTVARDGTVDQFGTWREPNPAEQPVGKLDILSWRFR